eukprot:366094-Chlamydomonas_euryale.AAC.13
MCPHAAAMNHAVDATWSIRWCLHARARPWPWRCVIPSMYGLRMRDEGVALVGVPGSGSCLKGKPWPSVTCECWLPSSACLGRAAA